ncbi:MAG: glycerophosphodiester phosphodiesterase family protein [Pyrinomonadaceae bacterium]
MKPELIKRYMILKSSMPGVILMLFVISSSSTLFAQSQHKMLIAHRGASSYAPEHTIQAYQLAIDQKADFVEQDLQITKDGILVCLHDLTLDRTTDVKKIFPDRFREERENGKQIRHWYVSDFTLAEIKRLDAGSWFDAKFKGARVPTFQEAVDLVKGKAGLYPETKAPEVYGSLGFDMERLLLDVLKRNGLNTPGANAKTPVIIQSFSPASLMKMSKELKMKLPLVLLLEAKDSERWLSREGLIKVKTFAAGIGPYKMLLDMHPEVVKLAHEAGLTVTPYTFGSKITFNNARDNSRFKSVREEMDYFLYQLGVDGLFTNDPDQFPRAH